MKTAAEWIAPAIRTYKAMTEKEGEDIEFIPMVHYVAGNTNFVVALDVEGELPELVANALLNMLLKTKTPATEIVVVADAYAQKMPKDTDPETHEIRRGELSEKFTEGDSSVIEMLVCIVVAENGETDAASITHRYTPVDGLEWGEIESADKPGGRISSIIQRFFMLQKMMIEKNLL